MTTQSIIFKLIGIMLSKRQKLAKFHQDLILDTAKEFFETKGLQQTSMLDIAKAGGYSKSTLYKYFAGKDDIYNHIVLRSCLLQKQEIAGIISKELPFKGTFMEICRVYSTIQEEHPIYFETMIGTQEAAADEQDAVLEQMRQTGEEIGAMIVDSIHKGQDRGELRAELDPLKTSYALWAAIYGILTMGKNRKQYLTHMNASRDEFVEYGFDLYMHSFLRHNP